MSVLSKALLALVVVVGCAWSGLERTATDPAAEGHDSPHLHNIHVSRGRMAIEGGVVAMRIRFFRHDLEAALALFKKKESLVIDASLASDSLFLAYLSGRFAVTADSMNLTPIVSASNEDGDIWAYELRFEHVDEIQALSVRNELFFELFPDQKHVLHITFFPSGSTHSLYFVRDAAEYHVSKT